MVIVRLLMIIALSSLAGCCTWAYAPARIDTLNVESLQSPGHLVEAQTKGKTGRACAQGILIFAFGDASIEEARNNGGITQIASIEYDTYNTIGIYARLCTVVRGE